MIIVNKPGELIASSHKIVAQVTGESISIITEKDQLYFRRGESINPRIIVLSVQGERVINLQFVPAADHMRSVYMPDYETAEKFLTFIEHFIKGE